jgi:hypothetical protein
MDTKIQTQYRHHSIIIRYFLPFLTLLLYTPFFFYFFLFSFSFPFPCDSSAYLFRTTTVSASRWPPILLCPARSTRSLPPRFSVSSLSQHLLLPPWWWCQCRRRWRSRTEHDVSTTAERISVDEWEMRMPSVVGDLDPRGKRVMVVGVGRRRGGWWRREREIRDGGERMVEEKR